MKLLFINTDDEKINLFKKKIQKIIKLIVGRDDDPFGNSCLIL